MIGKILKKYDGADFITQMKARFFFTLCLVLIPIAVVLAVISTYIQMNSPLLGFRINYSIFFSEMAGLLMVIGITILLIRGHLALSAHLITVIILAVLWSIIIFFDKSSPIMRLDTIVICIGILTMTPLVVTRRAWLIVLYAAANMLILTCFMYFGRDGLGIAGSAVMDYLLDNLVTIAFVCFTSYSVFSINRKALLRAEADIAARRRAEDEMMGLEAQLHQAQKMESIGRLAGGVAHDFNNILTAILGYTQLVMLETNAADPRYAHLVEVRKAADSATDLTRQLLAFSRQELISPVVIDLNELVLDRERLISRMIGEDVTLTTALCSGGRIHADPGQIEQILMNLAVNARDAMPGGGMLTIETSDVVLDEAYCREHVDSTPGEYVMLAVADNGTGMNDEVRRHLFEPFFTTKLRGKGTGLGLATIYGAVKQNRGSIEVRTGLGAGTSFKIYFPLVRDAADALPRGHAPETMPSGTETILLVEDDDMVREFDLSILSRLGYRVIPTGNGDEALAVARDHGGAIHLLMTDVILPGINGRDLADRLVKIHPSIKLLFTSGYTDDVISHHGVLDEGIHFIGKPFTAYALAKKLRDVLD